MRNPPRARLFRSLLLAATAAAFVVAACSDDPLTQPVARDRAAGAVCDFAGRCGNIGDGKTYATRDSCLTSVKGMIEQNWPPAECKKIVEAEYQVCLNSIEDGTCTNAGLDWVAILVKCNKATICMAQ